MDEQLKQCLKTVYFVHGELVSNVISEMIKDGLLTDRLYIMQFANRIAKVIKK